MAAPAASEREEGVVAPTTPYLSHSRVNRYLHCPEQYRLYYVEQLRPRFPAASLIFGQILHQALAQLFRKKADPVQVFQRVWNGLRGDDLRYGERESWEKLARCGEILLKTFVEEEVPRIDDVLAVERGFTLTITSLPLPFVGVIDLLAEIDGRRTVTDFKTAGSRYEEHTVVLSDQLSAYALAEPDAEEVALCVLLKTATPRIEWHRSNRATPQLLEYVEKVRMVGHAITAGHFYKRPGWWCGGCDYLPVCLGDRQKVREMLLQVAPAGAP
jgi:CRISPR/Cas system-associated exonuclease Cas4 (RecB family)